MEPKATQYAFDGTWKSEWQAAGSAIVVAAVAPCSTLPAGKDAAPARVVEVVRQQLTQAGTARSLQAFDRGCRADAETCSNPALE